LPISQAPQTLIRVQAESFDAALETQLLTQGRTDLGAVVSFTGLCRDEGGSLAALEIEHYPGMAEDEIQSVAKESRARWPALDGLLIIHRFGKIAPGEPIVLVVTTSAHRSEAFEAAAFLMDYLKTRAPFWKKQHFAEAGAGDWVAAKEQDDAAAERWTTLSR
jgi:molybdopterin synthase catalytic subunit